MSELTSGYSDEPKPLRAYAILTGIYATGFAGLFTAATRRSHTRLGVPSAPDFALLVVATYKLSRLLTKDWVTSFLRAPFTHFEGQLSQSEVNESPRGSGMRLAIGQLVT